MHSKRYELGEEIIKHNEQHFAMAIQCKVRKYKICKKLDYEEMRRKTLEGRLKNNKTSMQCEIDCAQ